MTTIAVRAGVMACDSRGDAEYCMAVDKVYPLPGGGFVGGAGTAADIMAAIAWMRAGEIGEAPEPSEGGGYWLLILRPDGSIWRAESRFPAFRLRDKFAAIGSGAGLAMAAMDMGADATQAVRIAAKYDSGTGGRIHTFALNKPARGRRA